MKKSIKKITVLFKIFNKLMESFFEKFENVEMKENKKWIYADLKSSIEHEDIMEHFMKSNSDDELVKLITTAFSKVLKSSSSKKIPYLFSGYLSKLERASKFPYESSYIVEVYSYAAKFLSANSIRDVLEKTTNLNREIYKEYFQLLEIYVDLSTQDEIVLSINSENLTKILVEVFKDQNNLLHEGNILSKVLKRIPELFSTLIHNKKEFLKEILSIKIKKLESVYINILKKLCENSNEFVQSFENIYENFLDAKKSKKLFFTLCSQYCKADSANNQIREKIIEYHNKEFKQLLKTKSTKFDIEDMKNLASIANLSSRYSCSYFN